MKVDEILTHEDIGHPITIIRNLPTKSSTLSDGELGRPGYFCGEATQGYNVGSGARGHCWGNPHILFEVKQKWEQEEKRRRRKEKSHHGPL